MRSRLICACLLASPLLAAALLAGGGTRGATGTRRPRAASPGGWSWRAGRWVRAASSQASARCAGTVTVTASGREPVSVTVGSSGAFSVPLPPGRYRVSGRSPSIMTGDGGGRGQEEPCSQPALAAVTAGHTVTITLTCIVP